jgi:hypothetical protein
MGSVRPRESGGERNIFQRMTITLYLGAQGLSLEHLSPITATP